MGASMFNLTLVDQLRLTFGQIVFRQKAHTQTAHVLGRVNHWLRAGEALLMIGVTVASLAAAYGKGHTYVIVSAVLASVALAVLLIRLAFDFEASATAHRVCSTKLWYLRERYRSLLCDLFDDAIDAETARLHRNPRWLTRRSINFCRNHYRRPASLKQRESEPVYSRRSSARGSTDPARRAGKYEALKTTASTSPITAAYVGRSSTRTSNSMP
jgi:SMODS and SLOG-associating 2TM effector domain family 4